jgi:branched-chain amino acid transport system ATP-binding protein
MALLEITDLVKFFGGIRAVDGVTFSVHSNQIKALIGPNGAGKTTIFNLLSGIDRPSSGLVSFKGKTITGFKPHVISGLGIGRTFQNTQLFDDMTVLENAMVGRHPRTRCEIFSVGLKLPRALAEERHIVRDAFERLKFVGLEARASEQAKNLPQGDRQLLEIARALATEPELLLLDEPAAGISAYEMDNLIEVIYRIRDLGVTVLLVEHDMGLVMQVSDEVVVLDYGKKIAEGPPLLIQEDEQVITAYLGREIEGA